LFIIFTISNPATVKGGGGEFVVSPPFFIIISISDPTTAKSEGKNELVVLPSFLP
jgi:hypothetical protein